MRRSSRGVNSKEWTGAQFGISGLSGINTSTAGWVVDPPTMIDDYESPTVIRTRVAIEVLAEVAAANNSLFGFGIYVATGDEDDVTVPTLLWDVLADWESDWIYRWVYTLPRNQTGVTSNGGADTTIESFAKRKVPRGAGILGVFTTDAPSGASTAIFTAVADVRVLLISG